VIGVVDPNFQAIDLICDLVGNRGARRLFHSM
jgi:hypothetical protein